MLSISWKQTKTSGIEKCSQQTCNPTYILIRICICLASEQDEHITLKGAAQPLPFFLLRRSCVFSLTRPGMASLTLPTMALIVSISGTALSSSLSRGVTSGPRMSSSIA